MNRLEGIWRERMEEIRDRDDFIPCKICGDPTRYKGIGLCNKCWAVTSRLPAFLLCKNGQDAVVAALEDAIDLPDLDACPNCGGADWRENLIGTDSVDCGTIYYRYRCGCGAVLREVFELICVEVAEE